jgi:hypothetical protein
LIGAASLVLTTITNRSGGLILRRLAPSLALVFAELRRRSGSLWPGLALHILINLPGAYGAQG